MLCELVNKAQIGDENAMIELITRFDPLLKKYASKLNYEDAYEDALLFFIELIKRLRLDTLKDGVIVTYINVSIVNYYNKKIKKVIGLKKEILISDLTQEQMYYVEVKTAKEDKRDILKELKVSYFLNENEYQVIRLIYMEGYTSAEIARMANKSRQAVNQIKIRALKKIKNILG